MGHLGTQVEGTAADTLRRQLDTMHTEMDSERSSFESHWRDLSENILPRRYRRQTTETNRGDKKNQKIIDSTGTISVQSCSSSMSASSTQKSAPPPIA